MRFEVLSRGRVVQSGKEIGICDGCECGGGFSIVDCGMVRVGGGGMGWVGSCACYRHGESRSFAIN